MGITIEVSEKNYHGSTHGLVSDDEIRNQLIEEFTIGMEEEWNDS